MRLRDTEARAIVDVIRAALGGSSGTIFLYGSRTDDALRGGDIDLVVTTDAETAARCGRSKHRLLADLAGRIGEQRVDLSFITEERAKSDPFWMHALEGAIALVPTQSTARE